MFHFQAQPPKETRWSLSASHITLSAGDMNAAEAKYHKKGLTELYNRVKSKRNDEKNENELFTFAESNEWPDFLSISGSPIFYSVVHSLCFSETSIHSATHSVNI